MNIDSESLYHAIQLQIDEKKLDEYNFDSILRTAEMVWDNTAVKVTAKDFEMIFSLIDYECLQYIGFDIEGEDDL